MMRKLVKTSKYALKGLIDSGVSGPISILLHLNAPKDCSKITERDALCVINLPLG